MDLKWLNALKANITVDTSDIDTFRNIVRQELQNGRDMESAALKARCLARLAEELDTPVFEQEKIVGSAKFWRACIEEGFGYANAGHIAVEYEFVLEMGLEALARAFREKGTPDALLCAKAAEALSVLILRYGKAAMELYEKCGAENLLQAARACEHIARKPAQSFLQAVQLCWFVHLFLHAEGLGAAAFSFRRFDQWMYPYYKTDVDKGLLTREEAKAILACFWLKCNEVDESQNLCVGGSDENEISLLCLEVTEELLMPQPSLSVRFGSATTEDFVQRTLRLIKSGLGMPAMFNDEVLIPSLTALGIPIEDATDYGIVGCYEANPPGALGLTTTGEVLLHKALLQFLPKAHAADFEEYVQTFLAWFDEYYEKECLPRHRAEWQHVCRSFASPFESACIRGCLQSGLLAEHKGAKYSMFGVNILGLGTLVDSLYAVDQVVFCGGMDYDAFVQQVQNNFPDRSLSERCKNMPGKFGTDSAQTNALARRLSEHIARTVIEKRFEPDVIPYPGFFRFTADIRAKENQIPATPDGRLTGERLSYGISASDFCRGKTPTSVLSSAAHVASELCADGNPMMLHLSPKDVEGEKGDAALLALIRSYFAEGGFHLQINVSGAETLIEAQQKPREHEDLMIRISGYSTYFVSLDENMQNALIERAQQ